MSLIFTDATFEAVAGALGITLADVPLVLGDPTHPSHARLVAQLSAGGPASRPAVPAATRSAVAAASAG